MARPCQAGRHRLIYRHCNYWRFRFLVIMLSRAHHASWRSAELAASVVKQVSSRSRGDMFRLKKKRGRRHKSADSLLAAAPVEQQQKKEATFALALAGECLGVRCAHTTRIIYRHQLIRCCLCVCPSILQTCSTRTRWWKYS